MANKTSNKGGRQGLTVRVKTAKGRKSSSTKWLKRQLNDPFVERANREGYRSRAAYKLIEIDDKFNIFKDDSNVIDLGAAPGSWTQVACKKIDSKKGKVIGIDLQEVSPISGVEFIQGDFLDEEVFNSLLKKIDKKFDVVMSDMAAASCGHQQTDHLRIMALCEAALDFAIDVLKKEGAFIAKVLQGGAEANLLSLLKKNFKSVKHFKPKASRQDSSEVYVVALGFRG